jgi:hypothetical protein
MSDLATRPNFLLFKEFYMRWLLVPILALYCLAGSSAVAMDQTPEIWFNPGGGPSNWLALFKNEAAWSQAANKIQVLTLVPYWIERTSDADLLLIADFAKRHHIQLDVDTQPVLKIPHEDCDWIEGYMDVGQIIPQLKTLKRLGIRLDWIDMDEPVWFGHYDTEPGACQLSIPELVDRTANLINQMLAIYPDLKIVEIEPIPALTSFPDWRQSENDFHLGLTRKTGVPIKMMQVDVDWNKPGWRQSMVDLNGFLHRQNMGLGIIYNATTSARSDAEWSNDAINNFEAVEGALGIRPAQAAFTTWNAFPTLNMPETTPYTLTWLINRFVRPRSELQVQFVGQGARGKLTTAGGKPIANATVKGFKPGVDFSKPLPAKVISGVVPAKAVKAIIGVRINAECGCDGLNDVLLGAMNYQETQGGSLGMKAAFSTNPRTLNGAILDGEFVGGTKVTRVIASPGQSVVMNSNVFPVTGNAQYQFTIPAATIGGVGWFGNVILIFIDAAGNGTRVTIVPDGGKALMSTAVTRKDGTFDLRPLPRSVDGPEPVTVEFDGGGAAYRSTTWSPIR